MRTNRRGSAAAFALCAALATTACGVGGPGDETDLGSADSYGATISFDPGVRFTDGVSTIEVRKGPIRLISTKPILSGSSVKYLGARARLLGPAGRISHSAIKGFPPTDPDMVGSEPLEGFVVPDPPAGETTLVELMFGFDVVTAGRTARRGAELRYEYDGDQRKAFVASYLAVCSPKMPVDNCPSEDEDGTERLPDPSAAPTPD